MGHVGHYKLYVRARGRKNTQQSIHAYIIMYMSIQESETKKERETRDRPDRDRERGGRRGGERGRPGVHRLSETIQRTFIFIGRDCELDAMGRHSG